jgi:hypothetical protein
LVITPDARGMITRDQAALLCGVRPDTVSQWISRGYLLADGTRRKLPVAYRWKGRIMLDPVEVAKAEHATARKTRRAA